MRMQGPDGGFHTGYDRAGTYAGTLENAETTSIVILALNSTSTFRLFPPLVLSPWIVYVFNGFAGAAVVAVIMVLILETRRKGQGPVGSYSLIGPLRAIHHKIVKSIYLSPTSVDP